MHEHLGFFSRFRHVSLRSRSDRKWAAQPAEEGRFIVEELLMSALWNAWLEDPAVDTAGTHRHEKKEKSTVSNEKSSIAAPFSSIANRK